jgi:hypothetical protein
MLPEAVGVMMLVVEAFDRLHIRYLVGGSMASALHGVTRSTLDADLVAELEPSQVNALIKELDNDFYIDEGMIQDAISHRSSFNLIHLKTMFKVDVFVRKERPFDQIQFQRRVEQVIATDPNQKAFVSTAEDIILSKLEWYRMGGEVSDRQWRDILGVLKVQAGRLDLDYLDRWADELGVSDLLQSALKESK